MVKLGLALPLGLMDNSLVDAGFIDGPKVSSSKKKRSRQRIVLSALLESIARGFCKVHLLSDALEVVHAINRYYVY